MAENNTQSLEELLATAGYRRDINSYKTSRSVAKATSGGDVESESKILSILKGEVDQLRKKKEYEDALLNEKKQILEASVKENEAINRTVEAERDAAKAVAERLKNSLATVKSETEAEEILRSIAEVESTIAEAEADINQRKEDIAKKTERALAMQRELNIAYTENVSFLEKSAALQDKLNNQKEAEKKITDKMNQDIAQARLDGKSEDEIRQIKEKAQREIAKSREENGLNKLGGLSLKDSFSAGLSEALSQGSVSKGISTIFSSALGEKLAPILAVLNGINKIVGAMNETLDKGITDALSVQSNYLSKVNSRLQGSDESFQSIQQYLYTNFGDSPFISQKKTLENIAQLVDTGTAENIKERGILMTLSDRMVSTFNALDGTLLRLNRLQQADLTASQLGYEGILTNFLNEQFGDTSYLSTLYDSVAGTILDATSQLDSQTAGAFNFAVQKWLGSLYAVGMSEQGINTIAQGLNYLATGNVEAFNSNEGLRNLFASASGSAFSGILTGGLNAETVDSLMMSIVEYLKEIAGDTNTVTRQARAGIFGGFSLSDIRSIQNLTASQLYNIYDTQKTYDDSRREVRNQLINAATLYSEDAGTNARAPLSMVFDNMVENVMYGFGMQRMSDPSAYSRWRIESLIANSGIPGLNLGANVVKLIDNILSGDGAFGNLVKGLWNVADTMVSNDWDNELRQFMGKDAITSIIMAEAPKHRGNADDYLSIAASNTFSGLSVSERLGLATDNLMDLSATAAATSEKTTYAGGETARDITDLYSELFERQTTAIKVSLANIDSNAATALDAVLRKNSSSNVQVSDISEIALEALSEYLGGQAVKSIADKVTTAVDVNVNTNFVDDLTQSLMYSRSL